MKILLLILLTLNLLLSSTLELSMSSSPSRLNPIISIDSASSEVSQWIFNGLLKYDKHGNVTTDLASSYKFINDKKLLIKLKKNISWHDGVKFTADDVIFTYEKVMDKNVFTPLKSNFKEVKSVKKLDDYTIEIEFKRPYFKALVTWMVSIIPKHILKDEKNIMTSSFNKKPVGTGPYILKEFKNSSDITLHANENYFEGRPNIDKIHYKFIPDPNTSFLFLKQKKLDLGGLTPLQLNRQVKQKFKDDYKIIEKPSFGYSYLGFNLRHEKFKDKRIREALSLGINRQELVDILYFGYGEVCNGPFLPGTFAYNEKSKAITQDIKKAKELLKDAGFTKDKPLEFELVTNTGNDIRINAAQILQYQLSKIGVNVKIRVMEWQAFINTVINPRNFEVVLLGWSLALMPDAYPLWHSDSDKKGGFNLVGYRNKEVDRLIEKGSITIDQEKLGKIYKEIFTKISNDLPYLFLYIPNSITVINNSIKNIEPTLLGVTHNQKDWIKD